jgi:hypothetical protein
MQSAISLEGRNMHLVLKRCGRLAVLCAAAVGVASPAHADGFTLVGSDMLALVQAVASQNSCIAYRYDQNGNLITRNNQTFGGATWGSPVFGCFIWTTA